MFNNGIRVKFFGSCKGNLDEKMFVELKVKTHMPTIYCDNISTHFLTKKHILYARTKHVKKVFHFVRNLVMDKKLDMHHFKKINLLIY